MSRQLEITEGIDLKIDQNVLEVNQVANESAKTSRSALYLIVVVSLITFIAYWNSRGAGWHSVRLEKTKKEHANILDSLKSIQEIIDRTDHYSETTKTLVTDDLGLVNILTIENGKKIERSRTTKQITESNQMYVPSSAKEKNMYYSNLLASKVRLMEELNDIHCKLEDISKVHNFSVRRVNMPIIGASFDINDLAIISGLALVILQFIFHYASKREYENLRISLICITKRYTDHSDRKNFSDVLSEQSAELRDDYLASINRIRREHHYNYLTMNEIYTLPTLTSKDERTAVEKAVTYLVYLPPLLVHSIVMLSDIATAEVGLNISARSTMETLMLGSGCWVIIFIITYFQIRLKVKFIELWDTFYNDHYKLNR